MFPSFSFDENKCSEGLNALANYKYKYDEDNRVFSKNPDHNFASHCADALQTFVLGHRQRSNPPKIPKNNSSSNFNRNSWLKG